MASTKNAHQSARPNDRRTIGPHSRLLSRGAISGRTREGRYLRAVQQELADHVGGNPSAAERMLISRLARVMLRLELLDEKLAAGDGFTDHDGRVYGALHNSFRLLIREVGLKGTPPPQRTLDDIAREIAADRAA